MSNSRIDDILIFLSVVDAGSFVAAGKVHGLTRSTAGKAVARLENRYGTRLLNRTTRALSLTEEGQTLYKHGQNIKAAIEEADTSMAGKEGIPSGVLRVTAPDAIGRKLLLPVVQQFLAEWPDVRVEINFSDSVAHFIADGFDLAIRVGVRAPDTSLITRTVRTEKALLCASPSYFDGRETPRNIEQLGQHDLLQFVSSGERQGWELQDGPEFWNNAPGQVRLRLNSAAAIRDATLNGMGIALLPSILVQSDISNESLVNVLPNIDCGSVPILALYPHKQFLEPKVRRFIDMMVLELR